MTREDAHLALETANKRSGAAAETRDVFVNGEPVRTAASTLAGLVDELGYGGRKVATALNGEFVAAAARATTPIGTGDRVEIVAPRQGG
jgi:sulfur carrier protein